jgi:surface protein
MDTDNNTEAQPQQETPRNSTVQEEQVDDDGVSAQREGYDEKKSEEEATPSDGEKLPEPKAPDHGQRERVIRKKDVKVKRDPSSTAVRPGAVAVPDPGATATTRTARKPSGIVPQTNQLREPSEVARTGPPSATKKNPVVKMEPSMVAPLDDSQVKMKEKAKRAKSQASDTAVQPVADAVQKLPIQPGAVAVQGSLTQQNTKPSTGPQQPVAQPGAVAVQGPVAAVRKKGSAKTTAAMRKKGSADQTSQPLGVPATTASKKGSEDQDIESGLLVPGSGLVDVQQDDVRSGGISSSDDVRHEAVAVQAGTTITTQNAELSSIPAPTMHTSSPNILTSKAAIANRTAAVQGRANRNGAAGVTDGALPVSESPLDKNEAGALPRTEEPRVGAVAVLAATGMEAVDMARPSSYLGDAVPEDNTVHTVPKAMLVTAETVTNEVDRAAIFYEARLAAEADVRRQMRTEVVNAEIVEESKLCQPRRRRRFLPFSLLALVVIVAAAVIGGVVGLQKESKVLPSMTPSTSPSTSPSMAPSMAPPMARVALTTENLQDAGDLWVTDQAQATETYGDISTWDVSTVTNMDNLFDAKDTFNADISGWDVSMVTTMEHMFNSAEAFNQDISQWGDVSKVNNMKGMFRKAYAFNEAISGWDVSKVTTMRAMFAYNFNQDISGWDVSNVTERGDARLIIVF